jgi:hypothetical protein
MAHFVQPVGCYKPDYSSQGRQTFPQTGGDDQKPPGTLPRQAVSRFIAFVTRSFTRVAWELLFVVDWGNRHGISQSARDAEARFA